MIDDKTIIIQHIFKQIKPNFLISLYKVTISVYYDESKVDIEKWWIWDRIRKFGEPHKPSLIVPSLYLSKTFPTLKQAMKYYTNFVSEMISIFGSKNVIFEPLAPVRHALFEMHPITNPENTYYIAVLNTQLPTYPDVESMIKHAFSKVEPEHEPLPKFKKGEAYLGFPLAKEYILHDLKDKGWINELIKHYNVLFCRDCIYTYSLMLGECYPTKKLKRKKEETFI